MNQTYSSKQQGFTIIELSLAMAFIAMLLISIALLTIQISTLYNKGLTLRSVNESGALIMRDIQQTLNSSVPTEITFVEQAGTGGRLCSNGIVYAWNYGGHTNAGTYGFEGRNRLTSGTSEVRMIRLIAADTFCRRDISGQYPLLPNDSTKHTALLKSGDSTLALHKFTVDSNDVVGDDTQKMYNIAFTLGTEDGKYIDDNGCQKPDGSVQGATDDSYCAVNTFMFTARAGNRSSNGV